MWSTGRDAPAHQPVWAVRQTPSSSEETWYGPVPTGVRLVSVPDLTMGMSSSAGKPVLALERRTYTTPSPAETAATWARRAPYR